MPVWHRRTLELQKAGRLQLVGLIQEQHADRCALFMQWKEMDWPILVDSLNRMHVQAVPHKWAIDEHGVLRSVDPDLEWILGEFANTDYPAPEGEAPAPISLNGAERAYFRGAWDEAVLEFNASFLGAVNPAQLNFQVGCAYRARFDSPKRQPTDFQNAVKHWTRALSLEPGNYIWRRRLQQYGPLLEKPYAFYDWIATARDEIRARDEEPHALVVEPGFTELHGKTNALAEHAEEVQESEPDAEGMLPRDISRLVQASVSVVPYPVKKGEPVRVHVTLTPSGEKQVHWDDEAGVSPQLWVSAPDGWKRSPAVLSTPAPETAASSEARTVEFEIVVPEDFATNTNFVHVDTYATYFVCEGEDGSCTFLRQDVPIPIRIYVR